MAFDLDLRSVPARLLLAATAMISVVPLAVRADTTIGIPSCIHLPPLGPLACMSPAMYAFDVTDTTPIYLRLRSSPDSCSSLRFIAFLPSVGRYFPQLPEGDVAPGRDGIIPLPPLSVGRHTAQVIAVGVPGGCNTGTLASWSAEAAITTAPK